MGWNSQIVIAQQVIIEGPGDGLFMYNGTPAKNNLVYSVVPAATADPYGNTVLAGSTTYTSQSGNYFAINIPGGSSVVSPGIRWYQSGTDQTGTYTLLYSLVDAVSGTANGLSMQNVPFATPPGAWDASLDASDPGGTNAAVVETWHSLGSPSATGFTSNVARFALLPIGVNGIQFACVDVMLTANAGGGSAGTYTYVNTMNANYQPTNEHAMQLGLPPASDGASRLRIQTNGTVTVTLPAVAAGGIANATLIYPLG